MTAQWHFKRKVKTQTMITKRENVSYFTGKNLPLDVWFVDYHKVRKRTMSKIFALHWIQI